MNNFKTTIRTNIPTATAAVMVVNTKMAPHSTIVTVAANSASPEEEEEEARSSHSSCELEKKKRKMEDCEDTGVLAMDRIDCSNIMEIDITPTTTSNDPAAVAGSRESNCEN